MAPKGRVGKKKRVSKTRGGKQSKDQVKAVAVEEEVVVTNYVCLTPKGREYRIPKLDTCPPAPMKKRLGGSMDGCLLKTPEGLFDHPEIEIFFMFAGN